jgi:hypothetical protein
MEGAMKKRLALALLPFIFVGSALADHIGIYRDSTAQSCNLAPGFNNTSVVMDRFSTGTNGVRFRVDFSNAPGSTFLSFNTPFVTVGSLTSDLSVGYGLCLAGSFVSGTMTAILNPGYIEVLPATGFPAIIFDACFGEYPATGGKAFIGDGDCVPVNPVEPSTWGSVKALYRD